VVLRVYLLLFLRSEIGIIFSLSPSKVCVYEIPAVCDISAISNKTEAGYEKFMKTPTKHGISEHLPTLGPGKFASFPSKHI